MGQKIKVKKTIPSQGGLGGASADAAAVLLGLDKLYSAKLTWKEICALGVQVGADVPFCLWGGAARVSGIGEQIQSLPALIEGVFVVAKPHTGVSTQQAFARFDETDIITHPNTEQVVQAVQNSNLPQLGSLCTNVFEQVCADGDTRFLKEQMLLHGALGAQMSGSGSAVFGLFNKPEQASLCAQALLKSPQVEMACVAYPERVGVIFKPAE